MNIDERWMIKDVIGPAAQWPTLVISLLWSQNLSPCTTIWVHYGHSALLAGIFFILEE